MITSKETYSISQVAELSNLSIPTIRYYDQKGLIPNLKRSATGVRLFSKANLDMLQLIECLKNAGMTLKNIKIFIDLGTQGSSTIPQRLQMLDQLRQNTRDQIQQLQSTYQALDARYKYLSKNCPFKIS